MKTRTVEYKDDEYDVKIVVQKANALTAMKKSIITRNNLQWLRKYYAGDDGDDADEESLSATLPSPGGLDDEARRYVLQRVMPDLLSVVKECQGLDLDEIKPEQFFDLPDALTDAWEIAVYTLNRHWLGLPTGDGVAEQDPKAGESDNNSKSDAT